MNMYRYTNINDFFSLIYFLFILDSHVVLSFPHFLSADKSFSEGVIGMNPDPDLHQIYLDIEPVSKFPILSCHIYFNTYRQTSFH